MRFAEDEQQRSLAFVGSRNWVAEIGVARHQTQQLEEQARALASQVKWADTIQIAKHFAGLQLVHLTEQKERLETREHQMQTAQERVDMLLEEVNSTLVENADLGRISQALDEM